MKTLKMPDGSDMSCQFNSRLDALDALGEYTEVMREIFCPICNSNCRDDCMFFEDGDVTEELGCGWRSVFKVTTPRCLYGLS